MGLIDLFWIIHRNCVRQKQMDGKLKTEEKNMPVFNLIQFSKTLVMCRYWPHSNFLACSIFI